MRPISWRAYAASALDFLRRSGRRIRFPTFLKRREPGFVSPAGVPRDLVSLGSPEGKRLLMGSDASEAYLPLSIHFETQRSQTFCGAASTVMVLNALDIPRPRTPAFAPYGLYTQDNVLNDRTDAIFKRRIIAEAGMSLAVLGKILHSHGVEAQVLYASDTTLDDFRAKAMEALRTPGRQVLVNYSRSALGQDGEGHISPLAGYSAETDRFLILDVARYKSPPVWVEAPALFQAMAERVSSTGPSRGFVIVRAKPSNPSGI